MMMAILTTVGAFLWLVALILQVLGAWKSRTHFSDIPIPPDTPFALIPVSILKPLKGIDPGLEKNLESFFRLDYPEFEILFSVANDRDPAIGVVMKLLQRYPKVKSRLFIGETPVGKNPKINNLIASYDEASYGWILISDSNVRVERDYLKRLVSQIDSNTGLITSVVKGTAASGIGGRLEAMQLNTFYAKSMILASWAKRDCVVGKSMLFRKSTAERFGGLRALGGYLAEDYMAGEAVKHLGLDVSTAWHPVPQHIGEYRIADFWARQVRWGRIRKSHVPLAFSAEPFGSAVLPGILGSLAFAPVLDISSFAFFTAHLALWLLLDLSVLRSISAKRHPDWILDWLLREALVLPLWAHTALGNTVMWKGERYTLRMGGTLVPEKA